MLVPVLQKDGTIVLKNPELEDVTDYLDTITEANRNDDVITKEIEMTIASNKEEVETIKKKIQSK